jgi:hypothetical protein
LHQVPYMFSTIVPLLFSRIESMYALTTKSLYAQYNRVLLCSVLQAPPMFSLVYSLRVLYSKVQVHSVKQVNCTMCHCLISTTVSLYIQSSKLPVFSVQQGPCIYVCMSQAQFIHFRDRSGNKGNSSEFKKGLRVDFYIEF